MNNALFANSDPTLDDPDGVHRWAKQYPSGTSKQSLLHYGQILMAEEFIEYEPTAINGLST